MKSGTDGLTCFPNYEGILYIMNGHPSSYLILEDGPGRLLLFKNSMTNRKQQNSETTLGKTRASVQLVVDIRKLWLQ